MIQELTDRGPSRTYPVYYLEDAMNNLGDCFDYAVNDYGAEGSEVAEFFCLSGVAREFERGNAWVVSGKSGVELFALIAERSGYQNRPIPDCTYRFEKTPEYWAGWMLAYLQWRLGESFEDLLHVVPFDVLRSLYYPWHEASEERVARLVCDMAKKASWQTKLALARKKLKKTQQDLAYESGVSLRSIQMYEQRQRNINEASVTSVRAIAKALHCNIEDLLEPVFEYKEPSAA